MVIAQITGGLGNQLFQYAAAKALSLHHNVPLFLEVSSFYREKLPELEVPRNLELFHFKGVNEKIITFEDANSLINLKKKNFLPKLIYPPYKRRVYVEPHFHFDKNFFKSKNQVFLKGGWQSEKYFKTYEKEIRSKLQLNESLIENVIQKAKLINQQNSVAVHIRRGDYLRKKIIYEWHGVMEKGYYVKAFELLHSKIENIKAYYFTDDPDWVATNLLSLFDGEIVSNNITKSHYEDFYLMSHCRNNIIANSSFSWWAAWLNNNPDKIVIAPKKWFDKGFKDTQDVIPAQWEKI